MDFDTYVVPVGVANAYNSRSSNNSVMDYIKLLDPEPFFKDPPWTVPAGEKRPRWCVSLRNYFFLHKPK